MKCKQYTSTESYLHTTPLNHIIIYMHCHFSAVISSNLYYNYNTININKKKKLTECDSIFYRFKKTYI